MVCAAALAFVVQATAGTAIGNMQAGHGAGLAGCAGIAVVIDRPSQAGQFLADNARAAGRMRPGLTPHAVSAGVLIGIRVAH